ncbi:hypothetical protein D6779_03955 [Candidatus Parcubacteria bacterium]|nr:MAG: hypothetical protein D6779_03955 [Candidatus Parcubacteria bacterium]
MALAFFLGIAGGVLFVAGYFSQSMAPSREDELSVTEIPSSPKAVGVKVVGSKDNVQSMPEHNVVGSGGEEKFSHGTFVLQVEAPESVAVIQLDEKRNLTYRARPREQGKKFALDAARKVVGVVAGEQEGVPEITASVRLSKAQYGDFWHGINHPEPFAVFASRYYREHGTKGVHYLFTVRNETEEKTVSCLFVCPRQLFDLRDKAEKLLGIEIVKLGV